MGENASLDVVKAAYRTLAKKQHPDAGGNDFAIRELNWAIEQAEEEMAK